MKTTGVNDQIEDILIHDAYIDVFFKNHGNFRVPYLLNKEVYSVLAHMYSGQNVLLATDGSKIAWIQKAN